MTERGSEGEREMTERGSDGEQSERERLSEIFRKRERAERGEKNGKRKERERIV